MKSLFSPLKKCLSLFFVSTFIFVTGCAHLPEKKAADNYPSRLTHLKKEEPANSRAEVELNKEYFKSIFTDAGNILISPINWDAFDWATATFVAGATIGLTLADEDIRDEVQSSRGSFSNDLATIGEIFGNGGYAAVGLGAFYLTGHFLEDSKAKRAALLSFESFVITGAFTQALKYMTGRQRPTRTNDSDMWEGPQFDDSGAVSFSSGHTATAFSIATVIANEYEDHVLVPPIAYGLAFLAGWSRMNDNKHWASDVFFGAALGYFTSKAILKFHEGPGPPRFALMPMVGEDGGGLMAFYRF